MKSNTIFSLRRQGRITAPSNKLFSLHTKQKLEFLGRPCPVFRRNQLLPNLGLVHASSSDVCSNALDGKTLAALSG